MPSLAHQWLVLWAARKMTADGYVVAGYDGPTPQGGPWDALPAPFAVAGHRPDAWGASLDGNAIALAEAKTVFGLQATYTRDQVRAFCAARDRSTRQPWRLYLAVPESGAHMLDSLLSGLGLARAPQIRRIHIPDCFLPGEWR